MPLPYTLGQGPQSELLQTEIMALLTTYVQPVQINGANALNTVARGVKDFTAQVPIAVVPFKRGNIVKRYFGGGRDHEIHPTVTVFADYTHSDACEQYIWQMYDLLLTVFEEHSNLGVDQSGNAVYASRIADAGISSGYITQGVPIPIRFIEVELMVTQHFQIPMGIKI